MPLAPEILRQISMSAADAVRQCHFHGTAARFDPATLAPGGDGVFWTADTPAIAQSYIPASGMSSLVTIRWWQMEDRIRPEVDARGMPTGLYGLALQAGFPVATDIDYDRFGQASTWVMPAEGYPRGRDVAAWLRDVLGYEWKGDEFSQWVKMSFDENGLSYARPADWRMPGRLFMVSRDPSMRIFDFTTGREGDLMDLDYHKTGIFRKLEKSGYDGVRIHDFCQSSTHGNVGHVSTGFFAQAIGKLHWAVIDCQRFDWGAEADFPLASLTPEFERTVGMAGVRGHGVFEAGC